MNNHDQHNHLIISKIVKQKKSNRHQDCAVGYYWSQNMTLGIV
jgi:hypothetical protein